MNKRDEDGDKKEANEKKRRSTGELSLAFPTFVWQQHFKTG